MGRDERRRQHRVARESKEAYWRSLDPATRIRLADELRRCALALHPDWPTPEQRAADYRAHVAFLERLDHASSARQR